MSREAFLEKVRIALVDREQTYGKPEDNALCIAKIWEIILDHYPIAPSQVALCLAAVKLVRLAANPHHEDSWVDLAGYAGYGAEVT